MKKTYKMLAGLIALSSVISMDASAQQLSGNYTINGAVATGGTNFQTFSALAAVINTAGISGPVTIDVLAGGAPYVEQVEFTAIAGTSATNTITINGNGNTLTYASANTNLPHTLVLSGTDYMTVNSLTVAGTGASFAMALHLWGGANENRFNNCRFEVPVQGTATKQRPVSLSGTLVSPTSTGGQTGNHNIWTGCTTSGGYAGFTIIGSSSTPYNFDNEVNNSTVLDFYVYGIYNYYHNAVKLSGNILENPNKTNVSYPYVIYLNYQPTPGGNIVQKNKIRRIFNAMPSTGSAVYGIYVSTSGSSNSRNLIANNVMSDISSNGDIYGVMDYGYQYNDYYNNTFVFDNTSSTYGYCYGFLCYGDNTNNIKNNLVSINRTGSGDKVCMYLPGVPVCNNNILYNGQNSANNYVGYNGTFYTSFASWQSGSSNDANGASGVPNFANPVAYDYTPTNPAINNVGAPGLGVNTDVNNLARNLPAPDAGAFEFFNQICTSVTGTNAVVTPTYVVCPTDLTNLVLANSYTVNGLSFQWQNANNAIGPFSAISGATLAAYTTPQLPADAFYNVLISCVNGGTQYTTSVGQISVAATTTNTPYYFEGFEGISVNKQLPNCSWYRSSAQQCGSRTAMVNAWRQARTGNKFAEFDGPPNGGSSTQYFWSNGLYLNAGVTYSASVWYSTPGWLSWMNLSLMYGTTQTNSGLVTLATIAQPQNSNYQSLSNTFSVSTSGFYYMAVKATDNWSGSQLVWDDLEVKIPCNIASNGAPVVVTGPSTVCAGQNVNIAASGAGSYTWSTGPNTSAINPAPQFNTTYSVTGTNTLSGCSTTVAKNITVHQLPQVSIVAFDYNICPGESVTLYGTGANSYTWSEGPTVGNLVTVSPQATTNYTLLGLNSYGCQGVSVQQVIVNPLPVITVSGNTVICEGNPANLTAGGAGNGSYTWKANNLFVQSQAVSISPMVTTIYTVSGVDANNCEGSSVIVVAVEVCTGINNISGSTSKVSLYPNPNNGLFTIELNNGLNKKIEVMDVTGRVVLTTSSANNTSDINIAELANGVYYIKVKSDNISEVLKVVKQ